MRVGIAAVTALAVVAVSAATASAAQLMTAPGSNIASGGLTLANGGSASGPHRFRLTSSAEVACGNVSFTNGPAIATGARSLTVQPTFSSCLIAGQAGTLTCGSWKVALPAPPPETHNATTGATTGLSITLLQGPSPIPVGYACRARVNYPSLCIIDFNTQSLTTGITSNNINATDSADVGDTASAGIRLAASTPTVVSYRTTTCNTLGFSDGQYTNGTYTGKARVASSTAPSMWIVPG